MAQEPDFVSIRMTREEYELMVRIVGHHVTGGKTFDLFERMCDLRPNVSAGALNAGPLPATEMHFYGNRPVVHVG